MRRSVTWQALTIASAAAVAAAFAASGVAAVHGAHATKPTVVTVTETEFKVAFSKKTVPVGTTVTFKVVNKGKIAHDFKISGKKTPSIAPGKTATFTVKLAKKGQIAYLCTLPGHAGAGMKGVFAVGVAPLPMKAATTTAATKTTAAPAAATNSAPAPAPAPAPAAPAKEALGGDPAAGAAVFASSGCGGCHTLAAAGSTGAVGPNLDLVKPTQGVIRSVVQSGATAGGAVMPAFTMNATDLNNIAAYVYQSTHP